MSRINTNVSSIVAARNFGNNQKSLNATLGRLSTGLRINSGKDDPAGLIASESLRAEQTGLRAAINNAERASNVLSVAEAGLQEISSLLLSLEDLTDRTANEAGLSADEVKANQLEIDSILDTINRIATSTQFNGSKLLDGTLSYTTSGVNASDIDDVKIQGARIPDGGSRSVVVEVTQSAQTAQLLFAASGLAAANSVTLEVGGLHGTEIFSFAGSTANSAIAFAINQSTELTGISAALSSNGQLVFNSTDYGTDAFVSVNALSGTFALAGGNTKDVGQNAAVTINGTAADVNGLEASIRTSALSLTLTLDSSFATVVDGTASSFSITGGGATFAISPTVELAGRESIGIDRVTTGGLGNGSIGFASSLASGQSNALNQKNFAVAQRIIRSSIDQVASLRGRIGAFQRNTLESTINSLNVTLENVTAAESAIRDADFAVEASKLTRAQILVAASTQVLQLANAAPQSALQLIG